MTDIVSEIKGKVDPGRFDFATAEGRAAFDVELRREIACIQDKFVRQHAGQMLKEWRWGLFKSDGSKT